MQRCTALLCVLALAAACGAQNAGYVVTDLGTLGGNYAMAYGLNAQGTVGGISNLSGGAYRAYSWSKSGGMVDLGVAPGHVMSCSRGVGPAGEVSGWNQNAVNNPSQEEAFLWLPSAMHGLTAGMHGLGTLGGNSSRVGHNSVNATGAVVGWSTTSSGQTHGFLWNPSAQYGLPAGMNDLGTLSGNFSTARAVNDAGHVVGASSLGGAQVATLWTSGTGLVDLGTLGGNAAEAVNLNQSSATCGWSRIAGSNTIHGWVIIGDGSMIDIGTLPQLPSLTESLAYGINDHNQVVGWVSPGPCCPISNVARAVIWDQANGLRDLNDLIAPGSPFVLESAWNINNDGQVVGGMRLPNGDLHAFLLTPAKLALSASPNPAPPSSTLVIDAAGGPPGANFAWGILKINGVYAPLLLETTTLDANGSYSISALVPNDIGGMSFTIISACDDVFGTGVIVSNTHRVDFL